MITISDLETNRVVKPGNVHLKVLLKVLSMDKHVQMKQVAITSKILELFTWDISETRAFRTLHSC